MSQKIIDNFIKTECIYPEAFTNKMDTTYGLLFHDEENKSSIISNHAIILPERVEAWKKHKCSLSYFEGSVSQAIESIISFYQNKNITPRIYSPLYQGFLEQIEPQLMKYHFHIDKMPFGEMILLFDSQSDDMIHTDKRKILSKANLTVKRLKVYSDVIVEMMYEEEKRDLYKNFLKRAIRNPNYHYYIGFIENKPVLAASIYFDSYRASRLGDIAVSSKFKALDYEQLMEYEQAMVIRLIHHYKRISKLPLYLYVDNPTKNKLYLEAGYQSMNLHLETWSAQYEG